MSIEQLALVCGGMIFNGITFTVGLIIGAAIGNAVDKGKRQP